jgi:ABC-type nitrate/sulfonate/bicarbonate transport system substrate-binding protein
MSGCSASKSASSSNSGPFVIRVSDAGDLSADYPFWTAQALGFDKEENIKFDYVGVVPSGEMVASVVAGKLDVGGAHINRTIAGISAGAKIMCVVAVTETSEDDPHMTFVVRSDSGIKTAQDMIGKRVGINAFGGCNEYTGYAWLLKNGIANPKGKYQNVILATKAQQEQALQAGQIDIAGLHDSPARILKQGGMRILFTDYDIWGNEGGSTPYYFSDQFIQEHPDVVRRFVACMVKTLNWTNANPDKARAITAARGKVDIGYVRALHYAPDGIIKPETAQVWIDLLTKFGEIKPGIKPADVYTNEFNDLATVKS